MSKLIHISTGREIQIGDTVTTFRGEEVTVTGWVKPHNPGSTGRIYVTMPDGDSREFFPSVCDCKVENDS